MTEWFKGWYESDDKEPKVSALFWIELTPNGKTLVTVYSGNHQEEIAEKFIEKLGDPEGITEGNPKNMLLLFPHQNLGVELKDIAERMTTGSLLEELAVGGGK